MFTESTLKRYGPEGIVIVTLNPIHNMMQRRESEREREREGGGRERE